jgi:hypothetical protein
MLVLITRWYPPFSKTQPGGIPTNLQDDLSDALGQVTGTVFRWLGGMDSQRFHQHWLVVGGNSDL